MEKIIEIRDLIYEIPHSGVILEEVNLEVHAGEFLGLLGHNGSGKTTLIDLLMGFRNTDKGLLRVCGEDPNSADRKHKHQVGFLSHDLSLKHELSIHEFLKFHSLFYPDYSVAEEERLLNVFKLNRKAALGSLSTGQLKKAQYIAAAASCPRLFLIDEVTAVFDPESRELFFEQLQYACSKFGTSILLATNIASDLSSYVDKVFFIREKKLRQHAKEEIDILFKTGEAA